MRAAKRATLRKRRGKRSLAKQPAQGDDDVARRYRRIEACSYTAARTRQQMAGVAKKSSSKSYRTIGKTYDGVAVLAPKSKSKTFTEAQVRRAIATALQQASASKPKKSLAQSDAMRIEKRDDGRFGVKRPGAKRASAVKDTQTDAVARARELDPGTAPIVKRVRKSTEGKKGTWRKA
jgi:uncharacterized protein YdaT